MIENVYLEYEIEDKYYSQAINIFPVLNSWAKEKIQSYSLEYNFDEDSEKLCLSNPIKFLKFTKFGLKNFNDFFISILTKSALSELFIIRLKQGPDEFYAQLVRRISHPAYSIHPYGFFYDFCSYSKHSMRVIYW